MTLSQMIRKSTLLITCVLASFNTAADTLLDHPGLQDLFTQRWYDVEVIVFERLDVLEFNTPEQLVQTTPRQWPGSLTWLESNPNQWDTPTLQVNGLPPQQRLDADTLLWTSRSTVDNESAQEQLINP